MTPSNQVFRSKRGLQFRNWIDFAVIIMMICIGIAIYTMITRYFKWKAEQVEDELRQMKMAEDNVQDLSK